MSDRPRILVTGASGTIGRRLVPGLLAAGAEVVTAGRTGEGPDGVVPVRFDWNDPRTHDVAVAGARAMYLIPPVPGAHPEKVMVPFLERARAAGVRRAVLQSSAPTPAGGPGTGLVHQAIAETFDEWGVLRPSWFMQNVLGEHPYARMIHATGTIVTATGGARVGFIDAEDIAAAAAAALLCGAAPNDDPILTGPEAVSYSEFAERLSAASGRTIRHEAVGAEELPARYEAIGVPAPAARFLTVMDRFIATGAADETTDAVLRLTGQSPRSIETFARAELVVSRGPTAGG